eukprot:495251-Prorocentrum_lima.AAC.1
MLHGVSDVQGHCKSIVYLASRFLQRADVAARQLPEDMDFSPATSIGPCQRILAPSPLAFRR